MVLIYMYYPRTIYLHKEHPTPPPQNKNNHKELKCNNKLI